MSRADSIRNTESIAALVSESVTTVDQTTGSPTSQRMDSEHLPDRRLALADNAEEPLRPLDRLLLVAHLHQGPTADQLLGLGEGPVGNGEVPVLVGDLGPLRARRQPAGGKQDTCLRRLLDERAHLRHQLRAWWWHWHRVVAQRVPQESHDRVSVR